MKCNCTLSDNIFKYMKSVTTKNTSAPANSVQTLAPDAQKAAAPPADPDATAPNQTPPAPHNTNTVVTLASTVASLEWSTPVTADRDRHNSLATASDADTAPSPALSATDHPPIADILVDNASMYIEVKIRRFRE